MKMLQNLLTECGYSEQQIFSFTYQGESLKWEHSVTPFVSVKGACEGYLLVSIGGRELPNLLKSDFLSRITQELGFQEFYSTDMDRNITLLLLCKRAKDEQIDHDAKVRIEDDPYYFKKYVFVYTEQEEAAAWNCLDGKEGDLSKQIRAFLLNTERFTGYKDYMAEVKKAAAEVPKKPEKGRRKSTPEPEPDAQVDPKTEAHMAYGFFVELATKVTVLPIRPDGTMEIRSVTELWQEELEKTPVDNLPAVEEILELNSDALDDILAKWDGLNKLGCE